jgi:hypothetical protein
MLFLVVPFGLADILRLPRDDTWHEYQLTNQSNASLTFWVQPLGRHSAVVLVHHHTMNFVGDKRQALDPADKWEPVKPTGRNRKEGYRETKFSFDDTTPIQFRLHCQQPAECLFSINHLHSDPMFRRSIVLNAFAIFVCLFATVLSWNVFCGACRATRKR